MFLEKGPTARSHTSVWHRPTATDSHRFRSANGADHAWAVSAAGGLRAIAGRHQGAGAIGPHQGGAGRQPGTAGAVLGLGRLIVQAQRTKGYGKQAVAQLAADLQREFPGVGGFSPLNVWRMRAFYAANSGNPGILSQAVTESSPRLNLSRLATESAGKNLIARANGATDSCTIGHTAARAFCLVAMGTQSSATEQTGEARLSYLMEGTPPPAPEISLSSNPPSGCLRSLAGKWQGQRRSAPPRHHQRGERESATLEKPGGKPTCKTVKCYA